ncbi:hypothetical protein GW931_01735 [archaeon]|nr:hypothetical protein [archaeon]
MEKEGNLSKIVSSFKSKLLVPVLAAFMFAGCYTSFKTIEVEVSQPRDKTILYRDSDRDGIPDIYDANPYFYDRSPNSFIWFNIYQQNFPLHNKFIRPWERYYHPKKDWKPKPKYNSQPRYNRDAGKTKLRNNDGNRGRNNQKSPPPRSNSRNSPKKRIR